MHVFVDESERGPYVVGAVVIAPARLAELRAILRDLRKKGERRIHFHEESPSHRRFLLAAFAATGAIRGWIYHSKNKNSVLARERCLRALVGDLTEVKCQRLVIESRESRDRHDRKTIYDAVRSEAALEPITYEHMKPYEEPLLWPADGIVWAYGAGGDWARRVKPLIEKVTSVDL